jgi:hypothetical protein
MNFVSLVRGVGNAAVQPERAINFARLSCMRLNLCPDNLGVLRELDLFMHPIADKFVILRTVGPFSLTYRGSN